MTSAAPRASSRPRVQDVFGLQIGVVARTHHRSAGDVREAHLFADHAQAIELVRRHVARDRQMILRRLQVRSEEHTSELQSLMRISYAVFCLKKKKKDKTDILQFMHNNHTK